MDINMKPIFAAAKNYEQATKEAKEKLAASEEILFKALEHLKDEIQKAEQLCDEARKIHEAAEARVGEEAKKETLRVYGVKEGHCEDDVQGYICFIGGDGMHVSVYASTSYPLQPGEVLQRRKTYEQYPGMHIPREEGCGYPLQHSTCTAAVYEEMVKMGRKLTGMLTERRKKKE